MDAQTEYYLYKPDFWSAYNNNGNNIKLALYQVCYLRILELEHLKTILKPLLLKLKKSKL